jgi:hypothetical protein
MSGVSCWTTAHDARGTLVKATMFDDKGQATRCNDGFARNTKTYGVHPGLVQQVYFDETGKPIPDPQGPIF